MTCRTYILLLCSLALAAGCGDDGMSIDPTSPVIESTNVADGATRVSILTEFEATASGDLDPASITSDTVRMIDEKGMVVAAEVSYDDVARTIRLRPNWPLSYDETYQWEIAGVQGAGGQAVENVTVELTTYSNPIVRTIVYDAATADTASYYSYVRENDRSLGTNRYVAVGADGQWFTGDDELGSYRRHSYDAMGRRERSVGYNSAGPDQEWFTQDDAISSYFAYDYDSNGNVVMDFLYFGPGADTEWFTEDDELSGISTYRYRDDGSLEATTMYTGPGPDQVWQTEDDERLSYFVLVYDEQGWMLGSRSYSDPGPDGVWETTDDVLGSHGTNVHDDRGLIVAGMQYDDPGPDGEWFSADDLQSSADSTTFDAEGNRVEDSVGFDPGADGQWGTADDTIDSRSEYDPSI